MTVPAPTRCASPNPLNPLRRRLGALAVAAVSVGLAGAGCSPPAADPGAFVIGAVIDRSGTNAEPSWGEALQLAERDMNDALAAAGHGEHTFRVVLSDSRNDPATTVERSLELVHQQGAKALILDTSQNAVAANALNYDGDASNDLAVPMQCSGCTSGSINNPAATNADPLQQLAFRNSQKWLFRTVMSTRPIALVINRDLLKLGTPEADV